MKRQIAHAMCYHRRPHWRDKSGVRCVRGIHDLPRLLAQASDPGQPVRESLIPLDVAHEGDDREDTALAIPVPADDDKVAVAHVDDGRRRRRRAISPEDLRREVAARPVARRGDEVRDGNLEPAAANDADRNGGNWDHRRSRRWSRCGCWGGRRGWRGSGTRDLVDRAVGERGHVQGTVGAGLDVGDDAEVLPDQQAFALALVELVVVVVDVVGELRVAEGEAIARLRRT